MRNFEEIRNDGDLLYEVIRGSQCHGLDTPSSDIDTFGLFMCKQEELYGFESSHPLFINSERSDDTWSELSKFILELSKSNPNALESLFIKSDLIRYYDPILNPLFEMRDELITKKCYLAFSNYAKSQIVKAKNLNKAINLDPEEYKERKSILHFCIVPQRDNDGSVSLDKFLYDNGLKSKYCGAVHMSRGQNLYNLYYDFDADKELSLETYARVKYGVVGIGRYIYWNEWRQGKKTSYIKYRGIIDENNETSEIRLSSISKSDAKYPICSFQYNANAYSAHCSEYKRFNEWVKNRNPERYDMNRGYNFDAKNMCECVRLLTMAKEMAQGKGMLLDRRKAGDREFLLSIKRHEISYEELMKYVESLKKEMDRAFLFSNLPEEVDRDRLEKIMIVIRKEWYKN